MTHPPPAIPDAAIPAAVNPLFQHLLDTYASETNKVVSTWRSFTDLDLTFRPHPKSSTVEDILRHQLLSERRFFSEFLGVPGPSPAEILPGHASIEAFATRMTELATPRLSFFAGQTQEWWLQLCPFFETTRQRIWIFWRRVLHTAHHRTQLTVYLRLLDRGVPSTYGPTADVTWTGADPTHTTEAAGRS